MPSTPEEQIRLNRAGPLFYALKEDGAEVKLAVLDERSLAEFCVHDWWTVKGRMQKPLRMIRSTPAVDQAILSARREALACALNLAPREFTIEELLREIVGLSYRAEVRPENKSAKVRSILEAGRAELERIYLPLLAELPYVEPRGDGLARPPRPGRTRPRALRHFARAPPVKVVPAEPPLHLAQLPLLRQAAAVYPSEDRRRGGEDVQTTASAKCKVQSRGKVQSERADARAITTYARLRVFHSALPVSPNGACNAQ